MREVIETILKSDNIIITTHINPDGDAVGSTLALFLALNKLNKERRKIVRLIMEDSVPDYLEFLTHGFVAETCENAGEIKGFDLIISLDAANIDRIGRMAQYKEKGIKFLNIDHHVSNERFGDINYIDDTAASTCEIVYDIIENIDIKLMDRDIGECLYLGFVSDTGNFSFNNVSEKTFRKAAELKKLGVDNEKIVDAFFNTKRESRLRILGKALMGMKYDTESKLVWSILTEEDFIETMADKEDCEGVVEALRTLDKCEVSLLIRADKKGLFKGSLRSKERDINIVAAVFNGGGHKKAAGFTTDKSAEEIVKIVIGELKK